jgi:hypothetical protein
VLVTGWLLTTLLTAGAFVVDGAEHAVRGMPTFNVVLIDPDGDRVTCLFACMEVVVAQQLPFQS